GPEAGAPSEGPGDTPPVPTGDAADDLTDFLDEAGDEEVPSWLMDMMVVDESDEDPAPVSPAEDVPTTDDVPDWLAEARALMAEDGDPDAEQPAAEAGEPEFGHQADD